MKISYKPLWKTLIDKNLTKKDLRLQAHLTTNHIANMGKGEHISMQTLVVALGAGLGIWGVINLMEGYGNDNPGAKSQGMKHLIPKLM